MAGSITLKSRLYAIIINFPDVVVHKILPEDIKFVWGEEDALRAFYLFYDAILIFDNLIQPYIFGIPLCQKM